MTIANSTISGNSANDDGGGIENNGTLTIINSTIALNSASAEDYGSSGTGGGIVSGGPLTITNSTIVNNFSSCSPDYPCEGAGIFGNVTLKNTIVASNFLNLPSGQTDDNCTGTITDAGYNISDDSTCNFGATGSQNNTDPGLSSAGLANNGGPTETIALTLGSIAIDVIPIAVCTDQTGKRITTDQRGFPRPDAGEAACDIGAYESSF